MNQPHTENPTDGQNNEEDRIDASGVGLLLAFLITARKDNPKFTYDRLAEIVRANGASWSTYDDKFIKSLIQFRDEYNLRVKNGELNKPSNEEEQRNTSDELKELVRKYQEHEEALNTRDTRLADSFINNLKDHGIQIPQVEEEQLRDSLADSYQQIRQSSVSSEQYAMRIQETSIEAVTATTNKFIPETPEAYQELTAQATQSAQEIKTSDWLPPGLESRVNADIASSIFIPLPNQKEAEPYLYAAAYREYASGHINDYDPNTTANEASVQARKIELAQNPIKDNPSFGEETHFFEALADRTDATSEQKTLGIRFDQILNAQPHEVREEVLTETITGALKRLSENTEKLTQAVGEKAAIIIAANLQSQAPGGGAGATPKQAVGAVSGLVSEITGVFGPAIDQETLEIIRSDIQSQATTGDKHEHRTHLSFAHAKPDEAAGAPTAPTTKPGVTQKDIVHIHETAIYSHLPSKTLIQKIPGVNQGFGWVKSRIKSRIIGQAAGAVRKVTARGLLQGARTALSGIAKSAVGFLKTALPKVIAKIFGATVAGLIVPGVGAIIAFLPEIIKGAKKVIHFINPFRIFGALGNMFSGGVSGGQRKGMSPALMLLIFLVLSPFLGGAVSLSTVGLPDPLAPALSSSIGIAQYRGGYLVEPLSDAEGPIPPEGRSGPWAGFNYDLSRGDPPEARINTCPNHGAITQKPFECGANKSHCNNDAYDFYGNPADTIVAAHDGFVVRCVDSLPANTYEASYGNYVLLVARIPGTQTLFFTIYAHLLTVDPKVTGGKSCSDPAVGSGTPTLIHAGETIGTMDATGYTFGNCGKDVDWCPYTHLHFEYSSKGGDRLVLPAGCP
jgi:hypothetical protein